MMMMMMMVKREEYLQGRAKHIRAAAFYFVSTLFLGVANSQGGVGPTNRFPIPINQRSL